MIKDTKQFVTGLLMVAVPLFFLIAARLRTHSMYIIPYIAISVMLVSGIATLFKSFKYEGKKSEAPITIKELALFMVVLFASVVMMGFIGFYVTIFCLLFISQVYLKKRNGHPSLKKSLLFAVISWIVIYLVFGLLLKLRVPTDVLLF